MSISESVDNIANQHVRAPAQTTNTPCISASYVVNICDFVFSRGGNRDQLLRKSEISLPELQDPRAYISLSQYSKLLQTAIQLTREPAIGLLLCHPLEAEAHALLPFSALAKPTYWKLIEGSRSYAQNRNRLIHMHCRAGADVHTIEFDTQPIDRDLYQTVIEIIAKNICQSAKLILQDATLELEIHFSYQEPEYVDLYHHLLGNQLHFGADNNLIVIKSHRADRPLSLANPVLAARFQRQCEAITDSAIADDLLVDHVARLLLQTRGNLPDQQQVAAHLNMSARTLRRRLKTQQTSFQKLRDQAKADLAKHYLSTSPWTIAEVASLVGYLDTSSFSYAFKQQQGISPRQYRLSQRSMNVSG